MKNIIILTLFIVGVVLTGCCGDRACDSGETIDACPVDCCDKDNDGVQSNECGLVSCCGGDDCVETNPPGEICIIDPKPCSLENANTKCGACIHPGAQEFCDNGVDNDCDGLVDCDDPDCNGDPSCGSICGDGTCDEGETSCDCPEDCQIQCGDGCCEGISQTVFSVGESKEIEVLGKSYNIVMIAAFGDSYPRNAMLTIDDTPIYIAVDSPQIHDGLYIEIINVDMRDPMPGNSYDNLGLFNFGEEDIDSCPSDCSCVSSQDGCCNLQDDGICDPDCQGGFDYPDCPEFVRDVDVTFWSNPSGAKIAIDGVDTGETTTATIIVKSGIHRLNYTDVLGYKDRLNLNINVPADQETYSVNHGLFKCDPEVGDCCSIELDGICDPDCDPLSLDPDCNAVCGDGTCSGGENPCNCPEDNCAHECEDGCCDAFLDQVYDHNSQHVLDYKGESYDIWSGLTCTPPQSALLSVNGEYDTIQYGSKVIGGLKFKVVSKNCDGQTPISVKYDIGDEADCYQDC
ncbi:PEGA domain-containing protein [Nanoarchaeota archaeon]